MATDVTDVADEADENVQVEFAPFEVPAGTPVGAAMRELDLPNKGDNAIVVVQDEAGELKDLSHVPSETATFTPVPANTELGLSLIHI